MKKTWIVLAMAAALCAACDDSKDDAKCVENSTLCDNGKRMVCTRGTYVAIDCPASTVCENGACVKPADAMCTSGALAIPQCLGTTAVQYCSNGQVTVEQCPANHTCSVNSTGAAYCKKSTSEDAECTIGEKRCGLDNKPQTCTVVPETGKPGWTSSECGKDAAGNQLSCYAGECVECLSGQKDCSPIEGTTNVIARHCNNGKWENADICNTQAGFVCRGGICYDQNACKTPNAIQCGDEKTIQTCTGGVWTTTDVCSGNDVCYEGKCQDASIPRKGDACTESTFPDVCVNNAVYYCDGNKIDVYKCGSQTCASVPYSYEEGGKTYTETAVNCYSERDKCDPSKSDYTVCINTSAYGYVEATADCLKADDNNYYKLAMQLIKKCSNGCDGDVCKEGGSNPPSGGGDDTAYDCSSEKIQGGGTAADMCKEYNPSTPVALCIPCNDEQIIDCGTSADIGKHLGTQYCSGGGSSSGGDDTLYDCSNSPYDNNGTTLGQYCKTNKGVNSALCIPCSQESFFCAEASYVGQHAGTDYCDGGASGGHPFFDCTNETLQDGTKLGADCAADDPTTTKALCLDCSQYYFCATPAEFNQYLGMDGSMQCD